MSEHRYSIEEATEVLGHAAVADLSPEEIDAAVDARIAEAIAEYNAEHDEDS